MTEEKPPENVSYETAQKVSRWERAAQAVERAKAEVNRCECELANATNDMVKYLTPADAHQDEKFNIWYGNGLITVQPESQGKAAFAGWRKKPTR